MGVHCIYMLESNSGPHVYVVVTLTTKPSPQPLLMGLLMQMLSLPGNSNELTPKRLAGFSPSWSLIFSLNLLIMWACYVCIRQFESDCSHMNLGLWQLLWELDLFSQWHLGVTCRGHGFLKGEGSEEKDQGIGRLLSSVVAAGAGLLASPHSLWESKTAAVGSAASALFCIHEFALYHTP